MGPQCDATVGGDSDGLLNPIFTSEVEVPGSRERQRHGLLLWIPGMVSTSGVLAHFL
ncbi:hypothetical protein D3C81_2125750 [compost metagenome]